MKNLPVFLFVLLCFQHAMAQRTMHFGLKASPNIGWLQPKSDGLNADGSFLGFSYGLITDFNFNENYSFGTGLEINHFSGAVSYDFQDQNIDGMFEEEIDFQYIQIPLTLKMRSKQIGYMTYYGQFGVGVGGLIGAKANTNFTAGNLQVAESGINYYDELKFFRASMLLGFGAEYNISGTTSLVFGLSLNNGFLNPLKGKVFEEDPDGTSALVEGPKKKANGNFISIDLGIIF